MARDPSAMDDYDDGYDTDATEATIIDRDDDNGYNTDEERRLNEYYVQEVTTPPPTNRNTDIVTPFTPPTQLLTNPRIPRQVYKQVVDQEGTIWLVPFNSDDYGSGEQPFDITGREINWDELPRIMPRMLFGEEKEGGASKSRRIRRGRRRRSVKKSLRKRKTNKRRKTRSKK